MATSLAKSVSHLKPDFFLGSGSRPGSSPFELGTPTRLAPPRTVYVSIGRRSDLRGHFLADAGDLGAWLINSVGAISDQVPSSSGVYAAALDRLKSDLDVPLVYVARCLGLRRGAVYKWYSGTLPHAANRSRLETIKEFGVAWRTAGLPSLRLYWDYKALGASLSLGDLLSAETVDLNALQESIGAIVAGSRTTSPRKQRLGFARPKGNPKKDRQRLSALVSQTSREDEDA